MIRAAIFDIDGTLIDSLGGWSVSINRYLKKINKPYNEAVYKEMHKLTADLAIEYLRREMDIKASADEIKAEIFDELYSFYKNDAPAYDGIDTLLSGLAKNGVKLAAATSNNRIFSEAALNRTGLLKYFSFISICDEMNTTKKEPLIFLKTAELLGEEPCRTAVFEDSDHAIKTAGEAGFKVFNIKNVDLSDPERINEFVCSL